MRKPFFWSLLFGIIALAALAVYYTSLPPHEIEPKGASDEVQALASLVTAVASLLGSIAALLTGVIQLRKPKSRQ